MLIYCCSCGADVDARLTDGREVYPHRKDLARLPFWKCQCGAHVGCHHKTRDRTRPLGVIPSPEISSARRHIHALIDPAWKSGQISRGRLYAMIGKAIGREYHTAELRTIEEARMVYRVAREVISQASAPRSPDA